MRKLVVAYELLLLLLVMLSTVDARHGYPYQRRAFRKKWLLQRNAMVVRRLYEKIVYPTGVQVAVAALKDGVVQPELSKDVKGRIAPIGVFEDYTASIEYFYALSGPIAGPPEVGPRVVRIYFGALVAQGNIVAANVRLEFRDPAIDRMFNATHIGTFALNKRGQVTKYDIAMPNLELTLAPNPDVTQFCFTVQQVCQEPLQQYSSVEDCVSFIASVARGTLDSSSSNTFMCRLIHLKLAPLRPEIHCAHVGPSGGGKCVDVPFEDYLKLDGLFF
mmetsp:Transcript_3153/g.9609  ORF Transcript_3153/g.9609 Transcript_3153/m.9609 type:complete len:275 (+) Transcript_3153:86-910(+)|eukprot:CAMPEP_0198731644 /NCGR_PEP_ID=MMETSP1475-20131203/31163_1 /TAXON_ID= ORGANISM="Unidentified sp., Strain CCMP1999" /NCGR_SAMPLE_ID=MMETSP1475 /ASSEMBLY_ACC=CAM_ASM_001111 /LENGTH=274 /DNA_ID=CAMNT_0044494635 /DNA_START=130 /DNA_END=954 /DNA_ORIENTATION=-